MKKLFTMIGVAAMSAMTMAQSVTTHSVYDVNQNGEINVADAVSVAQATLQEVDPEQTQQYVSADELNAVLQNIYQLLGKLEAEHAEIKSRLEYVTANTPDENGIIANGHDYVDLGVVVDGKPVYWATTNIGAELPADAGLYFAWGEIVGYGSSPQGTTSGNSVEIQDGRKFDWASYSSNLCGGAYNKMKKYCTYSSNGTVDNKTVLDPEDDAAHVNWQGAWRMPTKAEQEELLYQCTWTWTTMTNSQGESVNGYKVSNKTDSSKFIFLPAAGCRYDGSLDDAGSYGCYWSSSLYANDSLNAYCLHFNSGSYDWNYGNRYYGRSVRPVCQ